MGVENKYSLRLGPPLGTDIQRRKGMFRQYLFSCKNNYTNHLMSKWHRTLCNTLGHMMPPHTSCCYQEEESAAAWTRPGLFELLD
jgi:hypothetical protein